jgi:hypothetical protein
MTKTKVKSYQNVVLHLPPAMAELVEQALKGERDAIIMQMNRIPVGNAGEKKALQYQLNKFDALIDYVKDKRKEAASPTEVDRLINKIAKW